MLFHHAWFHFTKDFKINVEVVPVNMTNALVDLLVKTAASNFLYICPYLLFNLPELVNKMPVLLASFCCIDIHC